MLMRMLGIAYLTIIMLTIYDCGSHCHCRLLGFIHPLSFNYDCCGNLKIVLKLWSKVPNQYHSISRAFGMFCGELIDDLITVIYNSFVMDIEVGDIEAM